MAEQISPAQQSRRSPRRWGAACTGVVAAAALVAGLPAAAWADGTPRSHERQTGGACHNAADPSHQQSAPGRKDSSHQQSAPQKQGASYQHQQGTSYQRPSSQQQGTAREQAAKGSGYGQAPADGPSAPARQSSTRQQTGPYNGAHRAADRSGVRAHDGATQPHRLDVHEASQIAERHVGGGVTVGAQLERRRVGGDKQPRQVWEVKVEHEHAVVAVLVDAESGCVLGTAKRN